MHAFARSLGASVWGVEARIVDIQVSLPGEGESGAFRIVGLGDGAVREGRERIRGACRHEGFPWPAGAVTVNLAPAAARKEGPALDLPIALALVDASCALGLVSLREVLCLGELTLDGHVRPVRGALAAAEAARRHGCREALVPKRNAEEAATVPGLAVRPVERLRDAIDHLTGRARLPAAPRPDWAPPRCSSDALAEVRGQPFAARAGLVAAAGGHSVLMVGAPGAGKTLLARAIAKTMPPLSERESVEVSRVHSAAGLLDGGLVRERPFRAPHHTTSVAGLLGGGSFPRPGEVSLAHLGVLFLDEMAEFSRAALEGLRQPIEDGEIALGRAAGRARFPSEVVLVAAMNPCPCGWLGSGVKDCTCGDAVAARYRGRVSGPLLDRFDLRVKVKPVDAKVLLDDAAAAPPRDAGAVLEARDAQDERARRLGLPRPWNARIPAPAIRRAVDFTAAAETRLLASARRIGLSARGVHRALRVARTIADLERSTRVEGKHVDEAIQFRDV